jgi:CRP-like cAMP-binding protein
MIGYKSDLFDSIFVKPSELQEALAARPFCRSLDDQLTITTALKVSPFLRDLSETALNELASSIEYRLIPEDTKIFIQDRPIDAMLLVLKGRVDMIMEGISASQAKVTIGESRQLEPCGHIDMLFQQEDSAMFSDFLKLTNPNDKDFEDKNDKSNLRHRCFQPNIFASSEIEAMSEILLIPRSLFDKVIASHVIEDMKRRLDIIVASRLFSNWNQYDIIRLARMGQVKSFKSGDIIIEQAMQPNYLYLIMKGMCKAYKKPHRGEIYLRHLNILKAKAERHDMKYTYHHKMRHILNKPQNVNIRQKNKNPNESKINIHSPHLTDTEYNRHLLAQEIHKYEILLHKAQLEDAKHHCDDTTVTTITPSEENQSEVATLQWPMLFGEVSVLEPEAGVSQGTIVADTACDVFMIHKIQMQTFHVDEIFLERIKVRSVKYPNDVDLTGIIEQKKEWKQYRSTCLSAVKKTKWPGYQLLSGGIAEPFVI